MAAGSGVQFLQSNVEDGQKVLGGYKAQNTEVIRKMLRDQQREQRELHANPLFKEFRAPGSVRNRKFGKGYAVVEESGGALPFDPKSIEYEGQARMFDLIKSTAVKDEKARMGVWAAFGAPYVPLGEPKELEKTLPELNRDKMGSRDGPRGGPPRRKGSNTAAAAGGGPGQRGGPGGPGPGRGGGPGGERTRRGNDRPASVGSQGYRSDSDSGIGMPTMYGSGPDGSQGPDAHTSPAEAAIRAATREAEDTLNRQKAVMRFTLADRTEAVFPAAVLRNANGRSSKAKAAAGAFVNRAEAEAEMADPNRAYGQPPLPRKHLAPMVGRRPAVPVGGVDEGGDPSAFFLTQQGQQGQAGAQAAQDEERRNMSLEAGGLASSSSPYEGGSMPGNSLFGPAGGAGGGAGEFVPLTEAVVPLRGDEGNPVYKWHNDFVAIRHAGRQQLQQQLYARANGRANVRTDATAAAGMSTTLFGVLNLTQGRLPTYASGGKVVSPYARLDAYQQAQEAARRNTKQKAVQALDPTEIRILQRFYDQLCALVEAQRMSDPLCLMVVSKVKALLEAGVYLHKPMLVAVVEHVAAFARGAGMIRYNQYLLAVLTFITKCVGLDVADLEDVVEQFGVALVVYGTPVVPSRVTSDIVASLGAAEEDLAAAVGAGAGAPPAAAAAAAAGGKAAVSRMASKPGGSKGGAASASSAGAAAPAALPAIGSVAGPAVGGAEEGAAASPSTQGAGIVEAAPGPAEAATAAAPAEAANVEE
ncbi:hypothetical protein HYH03_001284 [Edaphochlamys debaryana]|uniref:Uncharacterized protein n=1 Tax=Edaphochlamys debaryana TaxID=47281 RepID=A0A835YCN3_9CHLO|nr:hypothetical protein HYH03_001284 [Edaphochlamys debaryana]|eukprot:KAG2500507.1 hypothetical protein HYH03_001284 [Edaphochlamys debaryana]